MEELLCLVSPLFFPKEGMERGLLVIVHVVHLQISRVRHQVY